MVPLVVEGPQALIAGLLAGARFIGAVVTDVEDLQGAPAGLRPYDGVGDPLEDSDPPLIGLIDGETDAFVWSVWVGEQVPTDLGLVDPKESGDAALEGLEQ